MPGRMHHPVLTLITLAAVWPWSARTLPFNQAPGPQTHAPEAVVSALDGLDATQVPPPNQRRTTWSGRQLDPSAPTAAAALADLPAPNAIRLGASPANLSPSARTRPRLRAALQIPRLARFQ